MSKLQTTLASALFASLALGCSQPVEPAGPDATPPDPDTDAPMIDAPNGCIDDSMCAGDPGGPACLVEAAVGTCVECTSSNTSQCVGVQPICGDDHVCRPCTSNSECGDDSMCDALGACSPPDQTFHVSAAGNDSNDCATVATACRTPAQVIAVATPEAWMRVHGMVQHSRQTLLPISRTLRVFGEDAAVDRIRNLAYPSFELGSSASLELSKVGVSSPETNDACVTTAFLNNLFIRQAEIGPCGQEGLLLQSTAFTEVSGTSIENTGTHGVRIAGGAATLAEVTIAGAGADGVHAIDATVTISNSKIIDEDDVGIRASNGSLTLTGSVIGSNADGGVRTASTRTQLINNIIHDNGATDSTVGGLAILSATSDSSMHHNTIVRNTGMHGHHVLCDGSPTLAASFNLLAYATRGELPDDCLGPNSVVQDLLTDFVDITGYDYHLTATSSARDIAAGPCVSEIDIDGDARPAGDLCDAGADEYVE